MKSAAEPGGVQRRRPRSLATRLALWYAASSFALLLLATGFLYWTMARSLEHEEAEFVDQSLYVLDVNLRTGGRDEIREEIEQEWPGGPQAILYVRLFEADGTRVAETRGMTEAGLPAALFPDPAAAPGRPARHVTAAGRSFDLRAIRLPFGTGDAPGYAAQVATERTQDEALLAGYRRRMAAVLLAALLVCTGVGSGMARRGLRPVARIGERLRHIRSTTLDERIPADGLPSELLALASTSNEMLDGLERSFQQISRFSADIAHELRTPIHNLRGEMEVALARPRAPREYRSLLGSCLEECARLTRLIDSLLFLARAQGDDPPMRRQPLDLVEEIRAVVEFYEPVAAEAGVALRVAAAARSEAQLDRALFQSALGNLIDNAVAATARGGTVTVASAVEGDGVRVEVSDTGCGIGPAHLPHVFDRLYRVDAARGEGAGLGLSIVKSIAALHGGSVTLASEPGAGTQVTLRLPARARDGSTPPPRSRSAA